MVACYRCEASLLCLGQTFGLCCLCVIQTLGLVYGVLFELVEEFCMGLKTNLLQLKVGLYVYVCYKPLVC